MVLPTYSYFDFFPFSSSLFCRSSQQLLIQINTKLDNFYLAILVEDMKYMYYTTCEVLFAV